jgi:DNA polymerase III subunit alpha
MCDNCKKFPPLVQLHNHSMFSALDAVPSPVEWLEWALKTGCPGLSITDHGTATSMYHTIRFKEMIKKYNKDNNTSYADDAVIGIPGVELYVKANKEDKSHMHITLWAVSNKGYHNLMKLSSLAYNDTVSYFGSVKPRVTYDLILQYSEGLKFGTGCIASPMGKAIMDGKYALAEEWYKKYLTMFGDNLYVEFHPSDLTHNFDKKTRSFTPIKPNECSCDGNMQKAYNIFLFDMVKKYGGKPIPATDAHFVSQADKIIQDCLLKAGNDNGWFFHQSYHQKESDEIFVSLQKHLGDELTESMFKEWITNTYEVMEAAKSIEIKFEYHLPKISIPANIKAKTKDYGMQTYHLMLEKIKLHGRWINEPVYLERFKKEVDVIFKNETLNFIPYFLLYEDICSYARSQGIFQNIARGSAGGSLISYYLKIIHIDPIKNNLPFERFLSHARIRAGSFPDIDLDLSIRTKVLTYLKNKYGMGFAQIGTFQKMKTKNAIKDAMWALYSKNRNEPEVVAICNQIPDSPQGVDEYDFLYGFLDQEDVYHPGLVETNDVVASFFNSHPEIESMVKRLIGVVRGFGRHPSAFVISTLDLSEMRVPTMIVTDKEIGHIAVTQYEAPMVEKTGLVKADILSVTTLETVSQCMDLVKQRTGRDYKLEDAFGVQEVYRLPEDMDVYADFYAKKTDSSFQFNTGLIKSLVRDFNPVCRENLSDFTALARPGAMDAPMDDTTATKYYLDVKNDRRTLHLLHDDLANFTSNGVFCIDGEQLVLTKRGQVSIKDIKVGDEVLTEDGSYHSVVNCLYNGEKETIKVRLSRGEELICTPDHKVLTDKGWVQAKDLNSRHLVKSFWVTNQKYDVGTDRDWLIGILLANGYLPINSAITVACSNKEQAQIVCDVASKEFGLKDPFVKFNTRCWYAVLRYKKNNGYFSKTYEPNPLRVELQKLGLMGKHSYDKFLPKNFTLMTLAGIVDGDGSINGNIRLKNKALAYDIYMGLDSYRIATSFFEAESGVFTTTVRDWSNLPTKFKKRTCLKENIQIKIPRAFVDMSNIKTQHRKNKYDGVPISRSVALRLDPYCLIGKHAEWSNVLSIKKDNVRPVYDLSIETNHSFLVGGNIVHNCYQEEIMAFLVEIAGYTLEESDQIRGAIAKKKQDVIMASFSKIRESCNKRGWSHDAIETVCQQIQAFSKYAFNRSHSRAYSELGYITMFMKHHHMIEWWTSVLNTTHDEAKLRHFVTVIGNLLSPPSLVNTSNKFIIVGDKIVTPLSAIKGVGPNSVAELITKGPFSSLEDFIKKVNHTKVNIGHFAALVRARAADCFMDLSLPYGEARKALLDKYISLRKCKPLDPELYTVNPLNIFMQERSSNQVFNKSLLESQDIIDEIRSIWPGLTVTNNKAVPLRIGEVPILRGLDVAIGMLSKNLNDVEFGFVMLYSGSEYKTGNSKKTGRKWDMLKVLATDGVQEVECVMWNKVLPLRFPVGSLIYVQGTLRTGYRHPVSITISEIRRIIKE